MASLTPKLKALLLDAGCYHEIWYSPITNTNFPVDSKIKLRHTANKTLKDAGLPKAF